MGVSLSWRRGRWRRRRPDWWQRVALVATLLGFAVFGVIALSLALRWDRLGIEDGCTARPFTCGMGTGLAVTLFAVATGFTFWTLVRKERLVALYLKRVRGLPRRWRRVFAFVRRSGRGAAPRSGMVPRPDLDQLVIDELRRGGPRPQLIVGPIGSGKTFAMAGLARALAAKRFVPVRVELGDGGGDIDFLALARDRFSREMRRDLLRDGEDFGVWQRLEREGRLVVLIDGLGAPPGRQTAWHARVRDAICSAAEDDYGLVVAARPEDVPDGLNVSVYELGPLDVERAADFVVSHANGSAHGNDGREVITTFLRAAEVAETPFYLDYIVELHTAGRLAMMPVDHPRRFQLRLDLLEEYVLALMSANAQRDTRLLGTSRVDLLDALAGAARDSVARGVPVSLRGRGVSDARRSTEDARRLGLVQRTATGDRFRHAIIEGYLAALDIVGGPDPVGTCEGLLQGTGDAAGERAGRNSGVAVAIAGGLLAAEAPDDASAVAGAIVRAATHKTDGGSFPLVTAAADIASLLPDERRRDVAADIAEFVRVRARAPAPGDHPLERSRLAGRLKAMRGEDAARALWALAHDKDYLVRLTAARRLAELGDTAVAVIERSLDEVSERRDADTTDDALLCRSLECWLLPSLYATARARRTWVGERLAHWLALPPGADHPVVEASLAQGFKLAAIRPAARVEGPVEEARWAATLLEGVRFWYSQVNLLQAVTVWDAGRPHHESAHRVIGARVSHPHTFVRRTARLCLEALDGHVRRSIWSDEAAVSSRAVSGQWPDSPVAEGWWALGPEASRLMADIILALNLIEGDGRQGRGAAERRARMNRVCVPDLAHCLGPPPLPDRLRVGGTLALSPSACANGCGQRLCPYPARTQPTYRGELSEAFCRHQASLRRGAAKALWLEMEHRVQA
jgi:hypothetical protein